MSSGHSSVCAAAAGADTVPGKGKQGWNKAAKGAAGWGQGAADTETHRHMRVPASGQRSGEHEQAGRWRREKKVRWGPQKTSEEGAREPV